MITDSSSAGLSGLSLDLGLVPGVVDLSLAADTRLEAGRLYFSNANWAIVVEPGGAIHVSSHAEGENFFAFDIAADPKAPPVTFSGYSSLLLADGTKLTLHSTTWLPESGETRPDSLLIISGDYGVQVQGLLPGGALCYVETRDLGWLIDAIVPDGALALDNPLGPGLIGDNPDGVWHALDAESPAAAEIVAAFGPPGPGVLQAGGALALSFMGSFRGAPSLHAADFDDHPGTVFEQHRLSDQEAAIWRLCLARPGRHGPLRGWVNVGAGGDPGVHPSWGAPGSRAPVGRV